MKNIIKVSLMTALLSTLWGCTANTKTYNLSDAQAASLRQSTEQLEQQDRDTRQVERMRRADAIRHATGNVKGGVTYSPTTVVVPR